MIRAHSLLYAIYICLIISLLCGALLYIANMYNQLNFYYVTHEELYVHNNSFVNLAIGNLNESKLFEETEEEQDVLGIQSYWETQQYGLLTLLKTKSFVKNDTVTSVHLIGEYNSDKTALYLTDFSKPLSYSGNVVLSGEKKLPSENINVMYINTQQSNKLTNTGSTSRSEKQLPKINEAFEEVFKRAGAKRTSLAAMEKNNDSIYYNSFSEPLKEIELTETTLGNIIIKGNIILYASDSIYIKKSAILEDIILFAPNIVFEDGFKGNLQAFASRKITVGTNVHLAYPSVLCLNNTSLEGSKITIAEKSSVYGSIIMFGIPLSAININEIDIEKDGFILGDIYCQGILSLKSDVYGSVYTNRFLLKSTSAKYENCIENIEINAHKRPENFISPPLFSIKSARYGILKKVL